MSQLFKKIQQSYVCMNLLIMLHNTWWQKIIELEGIVVKFTIIVANLNITLSLSDKTIKRKCVIIQKTLTTLSENVLIICLQNINSPKQLYILFSFLRVSIRRSIFWCIKQVTTKFLKINFIQSMFSSWNTSKLMTKVPYTYIWKLKNVLLNASKLKEKKSQGNIL